MRSKKSTGGAKVSDLQNLQKLVTEALSSSIESSMKLGEVNQTAIKNALQLLRDNDVVAFDDTINDMDRLSALLPPLDLEQISMSR